MHFASQLEQLLVSNNQMFLEPMQEGPQSAFLDLECVQNQSGPLSLSFNGENWLEAGWVVGPGPGVEGEQTLPVDIFLHYLASSPGTSLRDHMEGRAL